MRWKPAAGEPTPWEMRLLGPSYLVYLVLPCAVGAGQPRPLFAPRLDPASLPGLRLTLEPIMALSEAELLRVVPERSGIFFTDCPNCTAGIQEGQFAPRSGQAHVPWELGRPETMRCTWCGHQYPSAKYPMDEVLKVHNPRGEVQEYPYWANEKGYKHFFAARIDEHRIRFMERAANQLARAYALSGEAAYARRCAIILNRFAEVFPGYCYHFDYPFREKIIEDGPVDPEDFRPGYRTARWSWWAYMDIPSRLIEAWDLIAPSGELAKVTPATEAAVLDFFTDAVGQVLANRDDLTNMSPGMWSDIIAAGRIMERPEWVHEAVGRIERFFDAGFFHDGAWHEGAPSYNGQVVGNLRQVFATARGYTDPEGYRHPQTGRRFESLDIEQQLPAAARARRAYDLMRLPNGRLLPIHDTWSDNRVGAAAEARPFLLPGMGLGALAGPQPEPWQAVLTWGSGTGHAHYDGLALLLFAEGQELLSDLGYSHSRDRAWTLPTLSHNAVVIDHRNQTASPETLGELRFFDAAEPTCQVLAVDNPQVYPELASRYGRTLVAVAPQEGRAGYLVDLFEVEGGKQHDYLLHGCADRPGTAVVEQATEALATLLPEGCAFEEARHEGEAGKAAQPGYAYGYLTELREVKQPLGEVTTVELAVVDGPRLRAHLLTESGDRLVLGRNPAVRGARENDDALRSHWRPFMLWRRTAGRSLFASVIEPLSGTAALTARRLDLPAAAAIEVQDGARRDLVLLRPEAVRTEWGGRPLSATAELVVLRGDGGATVVGGELRWGDLSLRAPAVAAALLATDRTAGTLTVAGEPLPPGTVVRVDHAGRHSSAYTVVESRKVEGGALLTVAEDPGFAWDPVTLTARLGTRPGGSYTGPHTVSWMPAAHGRLR